MTVRSGESDPSPSYLGLAGRQAFAIAPAFRQSERDSIYVMWGGNSIKNPVVY